ncbi:uncharacterized protein LOC133830856 [Humulus lupulus]|uniref:uncharacterized protein LOC133830856 n=1 Tax=Humulus lupulus TaxID=3486 RepID=UPI002B4122DA|nr:uncharacterized protein LOC133830856 [Humulus lupulus]
MYPSNTWNIGNDPISFSHDQSLFSHTKPCFLNETCNNIVINANTTPNSKQPFFYFPSSPLFEDDYDSLLLPHLTQPLAMRENNNNNILSTTDKAAHVGVSAEPNNNNKDPMNPTNDLQQQHRHHHHHQKEDLSDLRKNHIRYDDDDDDRDQLKLIPRKKMMAKKDRHSKIMMTTGKRPRHRRMRLSLEVARQFFDLQDMLGYERASKTVEWLLIQARSEIKKLARKSSTASTTPMNIAAGLEKITNSSTNSGANSDCEVVSGLDEVAVNGDSSKSLAKEMKKRQIVSRPRCGFKRPRESRDKARERARERTKQKHMRGKRALLAVVDHHQLDNQDLTSHGLRSWSLETGEEESGTHCHSGQNINSLEAVVLQASNTDHHHEFEEPLTTWHNGQEQYRNTCTPAAPNLVEECSFLNVGKYYWSSCPIFNYFQSTTTSGSIGSIPQEHQFLDFQFFG